MVWYVLCVSVFNLWLLFTLRVTRGANSEYYENFVAVGLFVTGLIGLVFVGWGCL